MFWMPGKKAERPRVGRLISKIRRLGDDWPEEHYPDSIFLFRKLRLNSYRVLPPVPTGDAPHAPEAKAHQGDPPADL